MNAKKKKNLHAVSCLCPSNKCALTIISVSTYLYIRYIVCILEKSNNMPPRRVPHPANCLPHPIVRSLPTETASVLQVLSTNHPHGEVAKPQSEVPRTLPDKPFNHNHNFRTTCCSAYTVAAKIVG